MTRENLHGTLSLSRSPLTGTLQSAFTIAGSLSNATLRGAEVQLRIEPNSSVLQWKYDNQEEWQDLIDIYTLDYEALANIPTMNNVTIIGNLTPADLGLSDRSEGVVTITREGNEFVVTRPDGTTFEFSYANATLSDPGLMSSDDKSKLDGIEPDSQENVIETINVNGQSLPVTNKEVDIHIPTDISELDNDSNYATQSYVDDGLATKQDTLPIAEVTSADIGKALMPKTVADGEVTSWEFGEAGKVDDVQINGNSILNNKIANIPVADNDNLGVVGILKDGGLLKNSIGRVYVQTATNSEIKAGSGNYTVTPSSQSASTFYGLAKAAGDTTQSVAVNQVGDYTANAKSAIRNMLDVPATGDTINNVLVGGTSVKSGRTAAVPIANTNTLGVVKAQSDFGIRVDSGSLKTVKATSEKIKAGSDSYLPVVSGNQHEAAFYGLAKAAGDSTQSASDNAVGTYTNDAKSAIRAMLGVDSAIANAVGQITGFDFSIVQELPVTGTKGVIYLIVDTHGDSDGYDEYIWIDNGFEKLGHTDIDLSGYATISYVDSELDNKVDNVTIDGVSIVSNGVAQISIASQNDFGVVKIANAYGLQINSAGFIALVGANDNQCQNGSSDFRSITPSSQHASTFYGLAKAAGDTTQAASSNAVGTYTDSAKTAIKSMLGVKDDFNLSVGTVTTLPSTGTASASISGDPDDMTLDLSLPRGESGVHIGDTAPADPDISVWIDTSEETNPYIETVTGTAPVITAEANCRYMCGEVLSLEITPPAAGTTDIVFTSGSTATVLVLPNTVRMPEWWDGVETNRTYEICIMDGTYAGVMSWPTQ